MSNNDIYSKILEDTLKIINGEASIDQKDKAYDEFINLVKNKKITNEEHIRKIEEAYKNYYDDGRAWVDLIPCGEYDAGPIEDCIGYDEDFW
jgi:hypothetical protein